MKETSFENETKGRYKNNANLNSFQPYCFACEKGED